MSLRHYGSVEKTEIVRTREVQSRDRTGLPSYRKNYLPSIRSTKPSMTGGRSRGSSSQSRRGVAPGLAARHPGLRTRALSQGVGRQGLAARHPARPRATPSTRPPPRPRGAPPCASLPCVRRRRPPVEDAA